MQELDLLLSTDNLTDCIDCYIMMFDMYFNSNTFCKNLAISSTIYSDYSNTHSKIINVILGAQRVPLADTKCPPLAQRKQSKRAGTYIYIHIYTLIEF